MRSVLAAAVLACAVAGLTACGGRSPAAQQPANGWTVQISVSNCGVGWTSPRAGEQQFTLHNTDSRAGEAYLTDATSGAVYAYVDNLGPGSSADMDIDLGSGSYAFRCAMEDEDTIAGATVVIPGNGPTPTKPVAAVKQADLIGVTQQYQAYVVAALPALATETTRLAADIKAGHLDQAKADWLVAHLSYERLGAAYDAFGDADAQINGSTQGLPGGVSDKDFTGFHRIEYGLWNGQPATELAPIAADLVDAVTGLRDSFAKQQVDPLLISLRAHEIVENALQFELTGETDYGSHTNLATARANLDGASELIALLQPLLQPRYPDDAQLRSELTSTMSDLDPLLTDDVHTLPTATREKVDSDFSELTELLAPVASILEPRRVQ